MTNECNVDDRTIFCDDNLDVMRGINSECIDLIYLDPPFNKNKKFTAPIGSSAEGASFSDIFRKEDVKDEWLQTIEEDLPDLYHYLSGIKGVGKDYNFPYLAYMAIRLIECHRILKSTGSIYLHCDPTMSHYLKTTMDCIFGEDNFRNEIIWCYPPKGKAPKLQFHRKHDTIFYYGKTNKGHFNHQYTPLNSYQIGKFSKIDDDGRRYKGFKGKRTYLDESPGRPVPSWWDDIAQTGQSRIEYIGYPTQKPLALLKRIINASSNPGDIVLDPFCGCATTCVAAEQLERHWVGIDISVKAYELVKKRLEKEAADPNDMFKFKNKIYMKTYSPKRTDQGEDNREQKYVYVISHPNFPGEYKVGITNDLKRRLTAYQTSDPGREFKYEFKLKTPWFREAEKHIHETFRNKHEWVQGDLDEIIQAIKDYYPPESKV